MIVALAGGVGGAKLANGLAQVLEPGELVVLVNTGDDFEHLGLHVSPDLDSVMYKLAGLNDPERGWGMADESWEFMAALERLGGETWFRLGDRDLATHVERTRRLAAGETLSGITADFCRRLGIAHLIVPMSDDRVQTMVETDAGLLAFQDYFVRRSCSPAVSGFVFEGASTAQAPDLLTDRVDGRGIEAIVICPSNPFVSIDPILAIPAIAELVDRRRVPAVAVSPIIGGEAVKGPAAKMMQELGREASASAIAAHYGSRLDGLVIDTADSIRTGEISGMGIEVSVAPILMTGSEDERRLAEKTLRFAAAIASRR